MHTYMKSVCCTPEMNIILLFEKGIYTFHKSLRHETLQGNSQLFLCSQNPLEWNYKHYLLQYFLLLFFFMFDLHLACNFHTKTLSTKTWYILTALFPWVSIPPAIALFKYINQILKLHFKEQLVL